MFFKFRNKTILQITRQTFGNMESTGGVWNQVRGDTGWTEAESAICRR